MSKRDKIKALFSQVPGKYKLRLHTASNLTVPPSWNIEKRYIKDFHLLLVRGGHGYYIIDGHEVDLSRGKVAFVGGSAYYAGRQDISSPLKIIPLRFSFYSNRTEEVLAPRRDSLFYSYTSRNIEELEFLFLEIIRSYQSRNESYTSSLLHTVLCRTLYESEEDNAPSKLERGREWLKNHPLERTGIGEIAKLSGISAKYFTKLFKRQYGVSPKHYQVLQRVNYAKYLLQESDMSIKEISAQLNYTDQYIFSKQFKSITGIAPSAIRVEQ